jgi:hypothetical protein
VAALTLTFLAGCAESAAQAVREAAAVVADSVPAGSLRAAAPVNGIILHYVSGGQGPALILLHGFPEDWSAVQLA